MNKILGTVLAAFLILPASAVMAQRQGEWVLGVNEGVLTEQDPAALIDRYQTLGDYIIKHLGDKKKRVKVAPSVNIGRFEKYVAEQRYALIFGKSVHVLAKAVRDHNYQPIVKRAGDYRSVIVLASTSKVKTIAELQGRSILMPDQTAYTSKLGLATLREAGVAVDPNLVRHTRFQEAVTDFMRLGGVEVGIVNPTAAKAWREAGGRVLAETKGFVNWSLVAAADVSRADVRQMTEILVQMIDSQEGKDVLKIIGVPAFVAADKNDYLTLLKFIGE
jgi:phosphonate transport system substrate-binding protein